MPSSQEYDRLYSARYRDKFPGDNYKRVKARRRVILDLIRAHKNCPCMDCGKRYPSYVMHLDHRDPKTKAANAAAMPRLGWSENRVREEIDKCDPVCANCHAERTFGQRSADVTAA